MNRSKLAVSISALLLPLLMGVGCTRERVVVVHDAPPAQPAQPAAAGQTGDEAADAQEATADTEPPAEQVEAPGPPPSTEHVWIKGHWRWQGKWVWRPGHWETIRHGHEWVAGRWERRHHNWVWVGGHWRKI
jgi:hypothetical protein